jgi:hypothetical protein
MTQLRDRPEYVIGPTGLRLTTATLPSVRTVRWSPRRKAEIVVAVRQGLLTSDEACTLYELTEDELAEWDRLERQFGLKGLQASKLHLYRVAARCPFASDVKADQEPVTDAVCR